MRVAALKEMSLFFVTRFGAKTGVDRTVFLVFRLVL